MKSFLVFIVVLTIAGISSVSAFNTDLANRLSLSPQSAKSTIEIANVIPTEFHREARSLILNGQRTGGGNQGGGGLGGAAAEPDRNYMAAQGIGPPPDLPSLLLHNRIIYLGMPLVASVTELIVAEMLYLNYESKTKPLYLYINSPGTMTADGKQVGFETEAFAIADTMKYIDCPVHTIAVGQAFGAGALLLAMGDRGHRQVLPNASIMLHQPKSMARGQASDIAIKAREVLHNRKVAIDMLAKCTRKSTEEITRDCSRTMYLSPEEAVEYGLADNVVAARNKGPAKAPRSDFLDVMRKQLAR
ncbi:unnamed protein product [Heterosigma akashiwo]|uniref:ATP-dependent Clp protease proteolytic subunit n=1 Tax=Heterosigma akashiwo TaxID=2829 RepID=A0A7S3Y3Q0_HETAK